MVSSFANCRPAGRVLLGGHAAADPGVLGDPGADAAGVHRGHPDAVVGQLVAQRLGEAAHGELARRVRASARRGAISPNRLDTLTRWAPGSARSAGSRAWVSRTTARKLMSMTQLNSSSVTWSKRPPRRHPGVVDQQPDPRVPGPDLARRPRRWRVAVGQVDHVRGRPAAPGGRRGSRRSPRPAGRRPGPAAPGRCRGAASAVGQRRADAAGRAGDHGGPAGEDELRTACSSAGGADARSATGVGGAATRRRRARENRTPSSASRPCRISSTSRG